MPLGCFIVLLGFFVLTWPFWVAAAVGSAGWALFGVLWMFGCFMVSGIGG